MKRLLTSAALAMAAVLSVNGQGDKTKKITFIQDDAQMPFVSKVYELKHLKPNDITPFVQGAVNRYNTNSKVDRLNYSYGNKQFLVVSTPSPMVPYIDDMIEKIDRPCAIKDEVGSIISGTGIYRFHYAPEHRTGQEITNLMNELIRSGDGYAFYDAASNAIYWKDSKSDGEHVLKWVMAYDRPVPQVELTFKIYEVRTSTLDDIGVDYLAWKNGPGLNILSIGWETLAADVVEKSLSSMDMFSSYAFGGMFFAPQFDMSFVRMLSQAGDAKIATTASLTLVNSYDQTYYVKFAPENQNITKSDTDRTSVGIGAGSNHQLSITNPVICFRRTGQVDTFAGTDHRIFDYTTYANLGGSIQFKYNLAMKNVVERNNRGTELTDSSTFESYITMDMGVENLLAVCTMDQDVEQTIGIPFLSDIPYLKYLFSTTTTVKEESKLFITVQARLVHPEDSFAAWAGKLVKPEAITASAKK